MKERSREEELAILQDIKNGDDRILEALYKEWRSPFIRWAIQHHTKDEYIASEAFQRSFTIFAINIRKNKLNELKSKMLTYLFGIGKRIFFEIYKQESRYVGQEEIPEVIMSLSLEYYDSDLQEHQKELFKRLFGYLGEKCRQVLEMFYYRSFSMESIADRLGYKDSDVAKKKRYECIQKLKKLMDDHGIQKDDFTK